MTNLNEPDAKDIGILLRLLKQLANEPGDPRVRKKMLQKSLESLIASEAMHPRLAESIRREFVLRASGIAPRFVETSHLPAKARSLAPRHLRVLTRLLNGESEKEVARHLGLSPHTVHEYVKSIYRSFEVESRSELLAHWIGKPIPQLQSENAMQQLQISA